MSDAPDLVVETVDGVLWLVLNRPGVLNAVSPAMVEAGVQAIAAAQADPAIRVIALRGAGRAFCAGGDLRAMAARDAWDHDRHLAYFRSVHRLTEAIFTSGKPTVAVLHGACYGAGLAFALACDLRLARPDARFGVAFLNVGLAGDHAVAWLLARCIGPARAKEALLRAATFDAPEAARLGLVSALLPAAAPEAALRAELARLAERPALAVGIVKSTIDAPDFTALRAALDHDAETQARAIASADHRRCRDALLQR